MMEKNIGNGIVGVRWRLYCISSVYKQLKVLTFHTQEKIQFHHDEFAPENSSNLESVVHVMSKVQNCNYTKHVVMLNAFVSVHFPSARQNRDALQWWQQKFTPLISHGYNFHSIICPESQVHRRGTWDSKGRPKTSIQLMSTQLTVFTVFTAQYSPGNSALLIYHIQINFSLAYHILFPAVALAASFISWLRLKSWSLPSLQVAVDDIDNYPN